MENLNRSADRMLFAALPGYTVTASPRRGKTESADPGPPLPMTFTEFTTEILSWTRWWNTGRFCWLTHSRGEGDAEPGKLANAVLDDELEPVAGIADGASAAALMAA
ncbi:hypothetical protein [Wenjunlia tyrosinilytica]|uniref:hypothetical protein n=1 Tax=Wenjunlia tyrosinilytica TaxID=1544741 RepID=UPI00166B84D2|nr:hypothetical protein [Wenjunlia tyrosinilytica]